eukprot:1033967-Prymnesium_polylepis.1
MRRDILRDADARVRHLMPQRAQGPRAAARAPPPPALCPRLALASRSRIRIVGRSTCTCASRTRCASLRRGWARAAH